jgi:hypothetical protein
MTFNFHDILVFINMKSNFIWVKRSYLYSTYMMYIILIYRTSEANIIVNTVIKWTITKNKIYFKCMYDFLKTIDF